MSRTTRRGGVRIAALVLAVVSLSGCADGRDRDDSAPEVEPMDGFSWIVDERLAGMPRPGRDGALAADLVFLEAQKIDLLVSVAETAIDPDRLAASGIAALHLPVADFTAPDPDQLEQFVSRARQVIAADGRVGVHCAAGKGRTGTFLAAYLVATGIPPEEAIARVRRQRPGSIETPDQENAIHEFGRGIGSDRPNS